LLNLAQGANCQAFVLMPFTSGDRVLGGILLGSENPETLTPANLEPYYSITEMANTALEKIAAIEGITQSYAELQSLNSIGQAISTETELDTLFEILHCQIVQVVGKVDYLIALYDSETELIEIPYLTEGDQILSMPAFPLGRGLASIVIRSRQPLMITENTTERARALGAIVTGNKPAKSWLGVPMIIAGDVVGAVAIQDTEHEHRFTDSDLRLLTALAAQVAPIVRNARLLAETQAAAERDRHLYEITDQIRRATSLEAILEITTRELSDALNLKRARIDIRVNPSEVKTSPHKSEGGTE
jgi:GAF domain-containing protein